MGRYRLTVDFHDAIAWQSLMSHVDPLLPEGLHITISRINTTDVPGEDDWYYRVDVADDNGTILSSGEGYPLTEAMAEAYMSTPELSQ